MNRDELIFTNLVSNPRKTLNLIGGYIKRFYYPCLHSRSVCDVVLGLFGIRIIKSLVKFHQRSVKANGLMRVTNIKIA